VLVEKDEEDLVADRTLMAIRDMRCKKGLERQ
jgi:hypothetical protein